jgi:hypothetical protein
MLTLDDYRNTYFHLADAANRASKAADRFQKREGSASLSEAEYECFVANLRVHRAMAEAAHKMASEYFNNYVKPKLDL